MKGKNLHPVYNGLFIIKFIVGYAECCSAPNITSIGQQPFSSLFYSSGFQTGVAIPRGVVNHF